MFKIEKNIPVPAEKGLKYPFSEMAVGDSFAILNPGKSTASSIRSCAVFAAKKAVPGLVVRIRKTPEGGIRIWRMA